MVIRNFVRHLEICITLSLESTGNTSYLLYMDTGVHVESVIFTHIDILPNSWPACADSLCPWKHTLINVLWNKTFEVRTPTTVKEFVMFQYSMNVTLFDPVSWTDPNTNVKFLQVAGLRWLCYQSSVIIRNVTKIKLRHQGLMHKM